MGRIQTSVFPAIKGKARTVAGNPLPLLRYVLGAQSHPVRFSLSYNTSGQPPARSVV